MAFYNAGKIIRTIRKQQGLTQAQLSEGIIEECNLSRIESGKYAPSKIHMEALMERLGFSVDTYISDLISDEESRWFELKKLACNAIVEYDLAAAHEIVTEMEYNSASKSGLGQQFIRNVKLSVQRGEECHTVSRKDSIIDAIRITLPHFSEDKIDTYFLSNEEIILINQLALYYANNDNKPEAIEILKALAKSINEHYVDEAQKAKSYVLVLYNLSKYLGQSDRYQEAIDVCDIGIEACVKNDKMNYLAMLTFNKAYCINSINGTDAPDCKELIYQAYYGCRMAKQFDSAEIIKSYAAGNMNISL